MEIALAHSLSAKKRVRQNAKRKVINRARKSQVKTQMKLDETAATSTMHKKTAARKKSRLARQLNTLKAKKSG